MRRHSTVPNVFIQRANYKPSFAFRAAVFTDPRIWLRRRRFLRLSAYQRESFPASGSFRRRPIDPRQSSRRQVFVHIFSNVISAVPPTLIRVLRDAPDKGLGSALRVPTSFHALELAPNYAVYNWIDDPLTPHDEMAYERRVGHGPWSRLRSHARMARTSSSPGTVFRELATFYRWLPSNTSLFMRRSHKC